MKKENKRHSLKQFFRKVVIIAALLLFADAVFILPSHAKVTWYPGPHTGTGTVTGDETPGDETSGEPTGQDGTPGGEGNTDHVGSYQTGTDTASGQGTVTGPARQGGPVQTEGPIKIAVYQRNLQGEDAEHGITVMPGRAVDLAFSVKNTGRYPCWVRVKGQTRLADESLSADILELTLNEEDWLDGGDGFFYYRRILSPGSETETVFDQLKISGSVDNRYLGQEVDIQVAAYGVQSTNNDGVDSVLEVMGWPQEG